jgi:hypothetical protein
MLKNKSLTNPFEGQLMKPLKELAIKLDLLFLLQAFCMDAGFLCISYHQFYEGF